MSAETWLVNDRVVFNDGTTGYVVQSRPDGGLHLAIAGAIMNFSKEQLEFRGARKDTASPTIIHDMGRIRSLSFTPHGPVIDQVAALANQMHQGLQENRHQVSQPRPVVHVPSLPLQRTRRVRPPVQDIQMTASADPSRGTASINFNVRRIDGDRRAAKIDELELLEISDLDLFDVLGLEEHEAEPREYVLRVLYPLRSQGSGTGSVSELETQLRRGMENLRTPSPKKQQPQRAEPREEVNHGDYGRKIDI